MKFNFKNLKWLWLSMLLMFLDLITKLYVKQVLSIGELLRIFPGMNLYYIHNRGLAFGLLESVCVYYRWIFISISILLIVFFIIFLLCQSNDCSVYNYLSYAMIIGGALGNLLDRILYGLVIDFIDIYIFVWHFPIFNVADLVIFLGIVLLFLKYCYNLHKKNVRKIKSM